MIFDSDMVNSTLTMVGNIVQFNKFIGRNAGLFYITGGKVNIYENTIRENGFLSNENLQGNPESFKLLGDLQTQIPYPRYAMPMVQDLGAFVFDFINHELSLNMTHHIYKNNFQNMFCQYGCAYVVAGTEYQQFTFEQNIYKHMVALREGSVFFGILNEVAANTKFSNVWL